MRRVDPITLGVVWGALQSIAVTPGGSTVVDSRSSTMAGPVSDVPAARS